MKRILPVLLAAVILAGSFSSPVLAAEKTEAALEVPNISGLPTSLAELVLWVYFLNQNPDGFSIQSAVKEQRKIEKMLAGAE